MSFTEFCACWESVSGQGNFALASWMKERAARDLGETVERSINAPHPSLLFHPFVDSPFCNVAVSKRLEEARCEKNESVTNQNCKKEPCETAKQRD